MCEICNTNSLNNKFVHSLINHAEKGFLNAYL